jgi:hypothetical protein
MSQGGHQYLDMLSLAGVLQNPIHKAPVRFATTGGNIVLVGGAPNTMDGIPLLAQGDRGLVKDQINPAENGIYEIAVLGAGANGTWVRSRDLNKNYEVTAGTIVVVAQGVTNGTYIFEQLTYGPILLGVTPLAWFKYATGTIGSQLIEIPFTFASGVVILKPLVPGDIISPCYVRIMTPWDLPGATLQVGTPTAPTALLAPIDVDLYGLGRFDAGLDFQAIVAENLLLTVAGPSTTGSGYVLFSVG